MVPTFHLGRSDLDIQSQLQDKARELLGSGQVTCVLGYEVGTLGVRPFFAYKPEDAGKLAWNNECTYNLVNYLRDKRGKKVAIVVKPCDSHALNILLHEGQVKREEVFVLGVPCEGTVWKGQADPRCALCAEHVPSVYDVLLGEAPSVAAVADDYDDVAKYDAMSPAEREDFWRKQFDKCIRCYACRQACFGCYCSECVTEQLEPAWQSIAITRQEKQFYLLMRAYHLAGRCVECNECERACPMNIPLRLLNRKVAKEVAGMFNGYRAGLDPAVRPVLTTFKKEEKLE
jgi:formate dehydrogenase (coenzyme F420) beta subunit